MPFTKRDEFIRDLWMRDFDYAGETATAQLWRRGELEIAVPKVLEHLDQVWAQEQLARIDASNSARAA